MSMSIFDEIKRSLENEYSAGSTQSEMADKRGISHVVINRFLSGQREVGKMRLETFLKLFPYVKIDLHGDDNKMRNVVIGSNNSPVTDASISIKAKKGVTLHSSKEEAKKEILSELMNSDKLDNAAKVTIFQILND